ncbi:ribbon-helix-helix domain-containing protein [Roseococcus suduntuyensis]|uniref:Antitoxin ParD1/3/4 n=1 Tax=Roseococcus suduntuyensis TaxID=455361 RepID=A0A840ACC4_9PROT|nr:ribbon-helix-helix domain-containing protein [Roseococcus suduntuyensis]MBB3898562.1 antitoxin ParD1/3/4 [Roseococcus suduntuyensis]
MDEQVAARGYSTSSEYVRELIRKDQEQDQDQDQERERLRGLLLDSAASAPTVAADDGYFDMLRRRVRQPQA